MLAILETGVTRPNPAAFDTDETRLAAVRRRDPTADGVFFYSVLTTGVYCRPSCAARPARAENIGFHATTAAAEKAGFRPCKRCRPTEAPAVERLAALVRTARASIEAEADAPPSLADLAAEAGLSRHYFHRLFRQATGLTPGQYARAHRATKLREGLREGRSVTQAIHEAGYGSSSRFYEQADGALGMTPTEYRRGGLDIEIHFAVRPCSLGLVLIAATGRGLCAIQFGDDAAALAADLKAQFPRAKLTGAEPAFDAWADTVVALVDAPERGLDLPLDLHGTAFQLKVWRALREVAAGERISYRDLAERIGQPAATRAVARACAANALAVAIPCHRVVRSDGALSGYRWGVDRKRALLDRESAA